MVVLVSDVMAQLAVMPAESVRLLVVVPPETEDLILEDLVTEACRVLVNRGEVIVGKTLYDAFSLL